MRVVLAAAFTVLLMAVSPIDALASPYEDCILQNMKGVQERLAAIEVRKACQKKYVDYKRERVREFGELLETASFKHAERWEIDSPGFHAMQFTNLNRDKTITYARISVAPAEDGGKPCDVNKEKVYAYRLSVKPNQSVRLIYPSSASKAECINVQGVLGRAPSWRDVSFSSSITPAAKDPLGDVD